MFGPLSEPIACKNDNQRATRGGDGVSYKSNLSPEEKLFSLFQLDPAIPAEYLATFRRSTHLEPEKELMLAVLEDAVSCVQKYVRSSHPKDRRVLRDTWDWIRTDEDEWLFSFNNVCETLGLDPGFVRRVINQMEERQLDGIQKPPPAGSRRAKKKDRGKQFRHAAA